MHVFVGMKSDIIGTSSHPCTKVTRPQWPPNNNAAFFRVANRRGQCKNGMGHSPHERWTTAEVLELRWAKVGKTQTQKVPMSNCLSPL